MKIRTGLGLWVCAALAAALPLSAQEAGKAKDQGKSKEPQKAKGQEGGQTQDEMKAAWDKAAMPNENHQRLNDFVGTWNCTVTTTMPGEEATTSTGRSVDEWILGGRYVRTEFAGSFPMPEMNIPFEGRGVCGYDNINKRYFSIWIDSMSTAPMIQYGQFDQATNSFTYTGDCMNPMGKKEYMKSVIKFNNKDNYVFTMYSGESPGALAQMMQITYTRTGPAPAPTGGTASGTASTTTGTTAKLASRTVEAGCGMCVYHMAGVEGCKLAVKVDGKTYLVKGADDVNAHAEGLCSKAKLATCTGQIEGDVYVCTKFELNK